MNRPAMVVEMFLRCAWAAGSLGARGAMLATSGWRCVRRWHRRKVLTVLACD